ncbi:MAG: tetratricopeptide repeat protein [Magnetococcales bacterium]|nr:tetratricopeptide repeat protein [Magnetococcales bacterium]
MVNYPGITVGHQALGVAIDMGCERVVLAGFDLCFSREGFTHVAGSVEQSIGPYIARGDLMVATNGGWMAETRYDFLNAIPSLAALAEYAAQRGCRLINPASSAARIDGVEHLPWEELAPPAGEGSAGALLEEALPEENIATRVAHCQAVEEELNRMRARVTKVRDLAAEGLACNDGLFGRKGRKPDFKYKRRMDEIERILDEEMREESRLVKRWGLAAMLKLSRPDKEREWSDAEIEKAGRDYYTLYRDNAVSLIRLLDAARQRVRSRLEEEKPRPDGKSLLQQWRQDKQPGRCRVFLDRRDQGIDDFPPAIRSGMLELESAFAAAMAQTEHDYKTYILSQQSSPLMVRAKAAALFRNRETERLRRFGDGLEQSTLAERAEYLHLIRGYLAELEQQPETAMRQYRQVTLPILLPESLQRLFTIALQGHDLLTALAVSRRLSEVSFFHVPYFAELLRLTGDGQGAVGIFEDYLKVVRKDFLTMVKLGRLYLELGQREEAARTFGRILEEDPENRAARTLLAELAEGGNGA